MRELLCLLCVVMLFRCSATKKVVSVPAQLPAVNVASDVIPVPKTPLDTLSLLSIDQWISTRFLVLEKPQLFRRHGYELARCLDSTMCTGQIDTNIELHNRRVRYDRFVGDTLEVTEVKYDSSEWIITFKDVRYSLVLYARTYKGALKDLLLLRDLDAARERWLGKTVYSRKGNVSLISENGSLSSKRVSRLDSLIVTDVRSGSTPLPINPIWLMVQSASGVYGCIPVRISWTNTMTDRIFQGVAWDDDICEVNPAHLYVWDPATWQTIDNHRITMNMTMEQVFISWGRAMEKSQKAYNGRILECWIYNSQELYFSDSGLIAIQDIIK